MEVQRLHAAPTGFRIVTSTDFSEMGCGVAALYADSPCSMGYEKVYLNNRTLESECVPCDR